LAILIRKKVRGEVPETVIEQIYDRTGGVPLFAEEFTKMVQELGVLDQAGQMARGRMPCRRARSPPRSRTW